MFGWMGPESVWSRLVLALGLIGGVWGCAQSHDLDAPSEQNLDVSVDALIAGFGANSSAFASIGSLSIEFDYDDYYYYYDDYYAYGFDLYCTGSLIAPRAVLTAKHCVDVVRYAYYFGGTPVFTLGSDSFTPTRSVPLVEFDTAPLEWGGFTWYGNDVGVVYLAEPIDDVTPIELGTLEQSDEGTKYVGVGFGERNTIYEYGQRRAGGLTLNATQGRTWEAIFGDFASFYEWYWGEPLPPECPIPDGDGDEDGGMAAGDGGMIPGTIRERPPFPLPGETVPAEISPFPPIDGYYNEECYFVEYVWYEYNYLRLEDSGDVQVGGKPGDSQPCYGDSGGPLARVVDGKLTAFGVTSGGVSSRRLQCDRGGIYASFLPETLEFLHEARKWVDPCEDLTVEGECDGDVARRCTSPLEGKRRIVELDCSLLLLSCETQHDGTVGCGEDDTSFADIPEPPYIGVPFPNLRQRESRFFKVPPKKP